MEWTPASKNEPLEPGWADVWQVDLMQHLEQVPSLWSVLDDGERTRADRFLKKGDRQKYVIGHAILRKVLTGYLNVRPEEIKIEFGEHGKPRLSNSMNPKEISFNIAHSADMMLIAVLAGGEVGIDVERIREDVEIDSLAARYFSKSEIAELREVPESERRRCFFECWTRKEAYVKAKGAGLHIPLDQFSVTVTPWQPINLLSEDAEIWTLLALALREPYVGAVVKPHGYHVNYYEYVG